MTTVINAVSGTGLTQSADASGQIKIQSNGVTTNALAWVNFDGTTSPGTNPSPVTIRSSYNVSSVTRTSTGLYTINFTNILADANYSAVMTGSDNGTLNQCISLPYSGGAYSSSQLQIQCLYGVTLINFSRVCIAIFGN